MLSFHILSVQRLEYKVATAQTEREWRLKDKAWCAQWDTKHYDNIQKLMSKIREGNNHELINHFFNTLDKKYNDHHNSTFMGIPILDISYTEDICTYVGLALFIKSGYTIYTHIASGSGATTPTPFDTALVTEQARVAFTANGFIEPAGVQIRMASSFPTSTASHTVNEMCVANKSAISGQTILSRNIFTNNTITHTINNDIWTCAEVIEFVPIV